MSVIVDLALNHFGEVMNLTDLGVQVSRETLRFGRFGHDGANGNIKTTRLIYHIIGHGVCLFFTLLSVSALVLVVYHVVISRPDFLTSVVQIQMILQDVEPIRVYTPSV